MCQACCAGSVALVRLVPEADIGEARLASLSPVEEVRQLVGVALAMAHKSKMDGTLAR